MPVPASPRRSQPSSSARWARPAAVATLATLVLATVLPGLICGCDGGISFGSAGEPGPGASSTRLRFSIACDAALSPVGEAIAAQLSTVGARVTVEVSRREVLLDRARRGEGDAFLVGWAGSSRSPLGLVASKLAPGAAENFSGFDDPEASRLLGRLVGPGGDEERQGYATATQELIYEEAPWLFGVETRLVDASSESLSGWSPGPAGRVSLSSAALADGGTLVRVALGTEGPPCLDPLAPADPQAGPVFGCIFEGLVSLGSDGQIAPGLAESWELATNARTLTVTLRPGVTFHDGTPLRSEDVVYTYQHALAGRLPGELRVTPTSGGEGVVVFEFSGPFAEFLELWGTQPIVPASYYDSVGPEGFAVAPLGTGPFKVQEVGDRAILLSRWTGYRVGAGGPTDPGGSAGEPGPGSGVDVAAPGIGLDDPAEVGGGTVSEVSFVFVPDPDRRLTLLQAGEVDLVPALLPSQAEEYRAAAGVRVEEEPGFLALMVELNNREPPFDDARVRIALNLALDRAGLALAVGPETVALPTAFLPGGLGFDAQAGHFETQVEAARDLLEEAGYLTTSGE